MAIHRLSAEAKADATEAFALFAEDDAVDASQLRLVLQALGIVVTNDESEELLEQISDGDEQTIGLDDFLKLYAQQAATRDKDEEIRQAFQLFDLESRGFITVADLRRVVREVGERFTDAELDEMVALASGGDGVVSREAFVQLMSGL